MLKGYLDRVFCAGFAYVIKQGEYLPGLTGKKGVIVTTELPAASDSGSSSWSARWSSTACAASKEEVKSAGTLRALRTIYDEGLMQFLPGRRQQAALKDQQFRGPARLSDRVPAARQLHRVESTNDHEAAGARAARVPADRSANHVDHFDRSVVENQVELLTDGADANRL